MTAYSEFIEDGKVRLTKRNKIYQARIYIGGRRYLYKTLGTKSHSEAVKKAKALYYVTEHKLANDLPVRGRTFSKVLTEYIASRQKDYDRYKDEKTTDSFNKTTTYHNLRLMKRISKFWHNYCGRIAVENITNKVLSEYIEWRRDYYHNMDKADIPKNAKLNPADKTIEQEVIFAKTVLRWAHDMGYRGNTQLPTFKFKSKSKIVRPAFTVAEYRRVYRATRYRINKVKNERWKYTRQLLHDYILILANTGMRVGEANNLLETDIEKFTDNLGRENYYIYVDGKTGRRKVVGRVNTKKYIDRVLERNALWQQKWNAAAKNHSRKTEDKGNWLFRTVDGSKIITLIDQFNAALESIDMMTNKDGQKFTLYSFRHFYAMQTLGKANVNVWEVSRNMGAHIEVLQDYYGSHATGIESATRLGGS